MINKLTKGGPGNEFLGDGKIDTSKWFESFPVIENQIKNEDGKIILENDLYKYQR